MTLAVAFRSAARSEFDEAALRYESNRAGLGAAFVAAIGQAISLAPAHPLRYPVIHRNIRRLRANNSSPEIMSPRSASAMPASSSANSSGDRRTSVSSSQVTTTTCVPSMNSTSSSAT